MLQRNWQCRCSGAAFFVIAASSVFCSVDSKLSSVRANQSMCVHCKNKRAPSVRGVFIDLADFMDLTFSRRAQANCLT